MGGKIYTKTGDKGETGLFGGRRVWKNDLRIEAYGSVDELNSILGVALTEIKNAKISDILKRIQSELFVLGSDLASPPEDAKGSFVIPRTEEKHYKKIEEDIDKIEEQLLPLKNFILPGGSRGASFLHLARTVCRRAERKCVALKKYVENIDNILVYLNRLSDLLFVLSRFENQNCGVPDIEWKK